MKSLLKTFAILAVTTTMAFAAPNNFEVGVYNVKNTNTLRVFIDKQAKEALNVEILDKSGNVLHAETVSKKKMKTALLIDMASLDPGNYVLKISDRKSSYTKDFELKRERKEEFKIVI